MTDVMEAHARAFAALGHPTRLGIVAFLRDQGEEAQRVGRIQAALGVPASTLSHHLDVLRAAGVVRTTRQERFIYCRLQGDVLAALAAVLREGPGE